MKIKNIIFDVGGVLADPKSGHWFITPNFWNILDKKYIEEEMLNDSLKKYSYLQTQEPKTELEEHKMFSDYYYQVLKEINYPNINKNISDKIADDCVYNDDKFIFYDDVNKTLKQLSKQYNLYIISNGWPSSFRVLKNKNIDFYFKDIFISSMQSTIKEEKLFDIFLTEHQNVKPKESLYIDDRIHVLDKAKEYGFELLLMDRKNINMECKYNKITRVDEIESIIQKMELSIDKDEN